MKRTLDEKHEETLDNAHKIGIIEQEKNLSTDIIQDPVTHTRANAAADRKRQSFASCGCESGSDFPRATLRSLTLRHKLSDSQPPRDCVLCVSTLRAVGYRHRRCRRRRLRLRRLSRSPFCFPKIRCRGCHCTHSNYRGCVNGDGDGNRTSLRRRTAMSSVVNVNRLILFRYTSYRSVCMILLAGWLLLFVLMSKHRMNRNQFRCQGVVLGDTSNRTAECERDNRIVTLRSGGWLGVFFLSCTCLLHEKPSVLIGTLQRQSTYSISCGFVSVSATHADHNIHNIIVSACKTNKTTTNESEYAIWNSPKLNTTSGGEDMQLQTRRLRLLGPLKWS